MASTETPVYDRVFVSKKRKPELNGKPCRIIVYGATRHSVLLEFENGERVIAWARAVRRPR